MLLVISPFLKLFSCFIITVYLILIPLQFCLQGFQFLGQSGGTDKIPEEAVELLILVQEAMAPEEETLASEEDAVPTAEVEVLVP